MATISIIKSKRLSKIIKILLIAVVWIFYFIILAGAGSSSAENYDDKKTASNIPAQVEENMSVEDASSFSNDLTDNKNASPTTANIAQSVKNTENTDGNIIKTEQETETETETQKSSATIDLKENFKESIGGSGLTFYKKVNNDVTGNWRVAVVFTSATMPEHALDYYNAYFESDKEIHFFVNLGLKTTTSISVFDEYLYVDVHEYVDKEEHDAKLLNSGMLLKSYRVNVKTGDIEEI